MKTKLLALALPLIAAFTFSGCFLPDKHYERLKSDYQLIRSEIVAHWNEYPKPVQEAFIRIDNALIMYDKARGGILKPLASILKEAVSLRKSIKASKTSENSKSTEKSSTASSK